MKNGNKVIALFVSMCILIGVVPMYTLMAAPSHKTETADSYTNNFDVNGELSLLAEDFSFYHDTTETTENSLVNITVDGGLSSYVTAENNRLERKFNASAEKDVNNDGNRPFWGMMYYTYKNRMFKDFTLEVDLYNGEWGTNFNAITLGSLGGGFKSNAGFTIGFLNQGGGKMAMFCGTAAEVKQYFDTFYIPESANGHTAVANWTNAAQKIKITVKDGIANVYVGDQHIFVNRNVGVKEGYISLCHGLTDPNTLNTNSYYDNLSITGSAPDPYVRSEDKTKGNYSNNFNDNKLDTYKSDFNFYFDTTDKNINSLKNMTDDSDLNKYMTVANGALERKINSGSEKEAWSDGNRPYWCMMYYTYKNQTFKDYKLTVDAHLSANGSSYHAITLGTLGGGFKSNGGYTLGFQSKDGKLYTYLGTASDVGTNFDDWYIHDCANKSSVAVAADDNYKISISVENGYATVLINGTAVYTNHKVSAIEGYVSLCNGLVTGSSYDNLVIEAIKPSSNIRNEKTGEYSNNFNDTSLVELAKDFKFYHDTSDLKVNSLIDITTASDLSDYMTVENNTLERKYNSSADKDPWNDGNRPYWSMMYYTYKNQDFADFTLTVDYHMQAWGSSYDAITVGSIGGGFKSNGGFTLGFQSMSGVDVFLGNQSQVKSDFDDWWIHPGDNKAHIDATADGNYRIEFTVKNGKATVKINGTAVFTDKEVGVLNGYISLCNGIGGSYFDNLTITGSRLNSVIKSDDGSEYLYNFTSNDPDEALKDFKAYYSDKLSDTDNLMTEESTLAHWQLSGGAVARRDQAGENFDENHYMAMQTFTKQKYDSFIYEADFVYGNAPGRIGFAVGQEELGVYASKENGGGGIAIVFDVGGNASLKGYVGGIRYSNAGPSNMTLGGQVNHIKITYYNEFLDVELNGESLFYVNIPELNGYVSFFSTKVPNFKVDNFKIIDLNKLVVDTSKQEKITAIEEVDDIVWNRTEDNTNALTLPEKLTITTDKTSSQKIRVLWQSDDYRPSEAGVFTFKATPMLPATGLIINPNNIVATVKVTVTVDYNSATTFKYYIDSVDDFVGYGWSSRYSSDPRGEDLIETPAKSLYYMENGVLRRLDGSGVVGDHDEMTSLVYTGKTFRNFQLDVDFRQGGNTWGQAMVGFGIEEPASYVTMSGGGAMTYLTMEGSARFRGVLVQDRNNKGEVMSPNNFSEYASTWRDGMHHLTLRVTKLKAILEVDGVEMLECKLGENYKGGYISLMSNKNTVMWDNLSVTALDYNGNVITFDEAAKLPDTFDPEDPLIGEEEDDGSLIEIIGLAFKGIKRSEKKDPVTGNPLPTTGDKLPVFVFAAVAAVSGAMLLIYFKAGYGRLKNNKNN